MHVTIRKFEKNDIENKVKWINNPENNRYLHYDLPLSLEKTECWFESHRGDRNRYDAVIEADGVPVGVIGLLSIDSNSRKAEYYITIGEPEYKGKGCALQASLELLKYGFEELNLNKIYLYTETGNIPAQRLFEKAGFRKEGWLREDILSHGDMADRFVYGYLRKDWDKRD